jgi:hypothetical protein
MNTPQPIVRTTIFDAHVDLKSIAHVRGARIDLAPGQETGLHLHPAPVVGFIVKGEIYGSHLPATQFHISLRQSAVKSSGAGMRVGDPAAATA